MTGTFQFIPHHKIADFQAKGWVVVDDMSDCHHGAYSVLMQAPLPISDCTEHDGGDE